MKRLGNVDSLVDIASLVLSGVLAIGIAVIATLLVIHLSLVGVPHIWPVSIGAVGLGLAAAFLVALARIFRRIRS